MKNKHLKLLFLAFAGLSAVLASCSKSDSKKTSSTDYSGSYMLTAATIQYAGFSVNAYDSLEACQKDDVYTLNADGSLKVTDAGVVCDPSDDATGTWSVSNDSMYVHSTTNELMNQAAKIKSFDGTTLVMTSSIDTLGSTYATSTTLTKAK